MKILLLTEDNFLKWFPKICLHSNECNWNFNKMKKFLKNQSSKFGSTHLSILEKIKLLMPSRSTTNDVKKVSLLRNNNMSSRQVDQGFEITKQRKKDNTDVEKIFIFMPFCQALNINRRCRFWDHFWKES